ncbi:MAG: nucleotidyltransferase domain-containing protein [Candidatus Sabulitectum sp.]|nr:nucleotidyltransferase domain-containing protein [Candidatus Sabulitectum sp.]
MDKETALEIVREYAELVYAILPQSRIVLFGSYACGVPGEHSDLDVAVVIDRLEGDFLDLSVSLHKLRHSIDERIEPILLVADQDRSGFLESILKTGYVL